MTDWQKAQDGAFYELLAAQVRDGYFDTTEDER